ncbi:DMT family transporter [Methylobacterium sp. J-048]|uniref:DMT family transporter n=1 Tax=Methylobacterium sp. J-048 TaxID=2836635 RepID=UPI001FBAA26E|nr:DMT family transporter [Methylobacterium sp. J-048]MCJ2057504.1 DMT family transporter [Methylobacterium sp. J-048]
MSAAMAISGTIGLFVVMSKQPLANVVFWRCAFGTVTLLLICAAFGLLRPGLITGRQIALAALGGVAIVANWLFLFAAYPLASIAIATAVYNTQPFMLAALGIVVINERPSIAKLAWLVLAFVGMLAIVEARPESGGEAGNYTLGIIFALTAAFLYALAAIVAKALNGVPPHLIALIQVAAGIGMLAPFADVAALPGTAIDWLWLVAIGVVHTGVMYCLLYGAIQKLPTSLTGALSFIYPIVAILVDRLAFGHHLAVMQWLGIAAILLAAAGSTLGWRIGAGKAAEGAA